MGSLFTIDSPFKAFSYFRFSKSCSVARSSASVYRFKNLGGFRKSYVALISLRTHSSFSVRGNYSNPIKPFSDLVPFFQKAGNELIRSSKQKCASGLTDFSLQRRKLLENEAFGTALMSVTTTAKVKVSPFMAALMANPTFISGLCACAAAQSMKVFLNFWVEKKWDFKIMFASGGMPSSHSALCTALTTSVAICHGVADSLFPVCLGFSLIVMYDAIGVRRHAGMQAEVLNLIVEDLFQGHPISQRKLKELLGHTLSQVFAGALLGIFIAWMCCQCSLVAM